MGLYLWELLFTITNVILLGKSTFCIPDAEHMWGKCITSRKDKIHVTCPLGYVIYRPVFYVAAHTRHDKESCGFSTTDCHGQARDTSVQINKCLWENTCTLKWHEHMPIVKSSNASCIGVTPNYVAFNNPLCLSSDKLYDICDYNASVIDADSGVLSNRQSSPHGYNDRICGGRLLVTLRPKPNQTLSVTVDAASHCNEGSFKLSYVSSSGHRQPLACGTRPHSIFAVKSGEIVVDFSHSPHLENGELDAPFVILFEQKPFQHQTQEILLGDDARGISMFGETSFDVRASISSCLPLTEESVTLNCPMGGVIFDPRVRMGSSGWDRGCSAVNGDCVGETPNSLVQRLQCYWQPTCRMSWQRGMPILRVTQERCLARLPDYFDLVSASCVSKESVYDLCGKGLWEMNLTNAILLSHEDYPWNYETHPLTCQKRLRVHRKYGLRILSNHLDLPPRSKNGDLVRLWAVSENNRRTLQKDFAGNDVLEETFLSGCVDIEFRKGRHSMHGQGFALKLEPVVPIIGPVDPDFHNCGSLSDALRKQKRRRSKNSKKKERRRNRIPKSKGDLKLRGS